MLWGGCGARGHEAGLVISLIMQVGRVGEKRLGVRLGIGWRRLGAL